MTSIEKRERLQLIKESHRRVYGADAEVEQDPVELCLNCRSTECVGLDTFGTEEVAEIGGEG